MDSRFVCWELVPWFPSYAVTSPCTRALQIREELDNQAKLNEARRNLAFGNAQADINRQCDELEEELRESREELEVLTWSCTPLQ